MTGVAEKKKRMIKIYLLWVLLVGSLCCSCIGNKRLEYALEFAGQEYFFRTLKKFNDAKMKKKFYAALLAVAVIAFTGYNVYQSSTLSDLALANVEALANISEERETVKCYCKASEGRYICSSWRPGLLWSGTNLCSNHDRNCR